MEPVEPDDLEPEASEPPDHPKLLAVAFLGAVVGAVIAVLVAFLIINPEPPSGAIVVQPGESLTDAIDDAPPNGLVELAAGDHGYKDFSNFDARGVTVRCQDGAQVGRFKLMSTRNLTLSSCEMSPSSSNVGVYINGGANITVEGIATHGGERGILVQAANKADRSTWTDGVVLRGNVITRPDKIDAFAFYGAKNVTMSGNTAVMSTDGCNVEHQDGLQLSGIVGATITGNVFTNDNPGPPNMTCPDGSYPHDQGVIFTSGSSDPQGTGNVGENLTLTDNTVEGWFSGLSMLFDGAGAKNIAVKDSHIICSARTTPKVTGDPSQITVTGSLYTPCQAELEGRLDNV